MSLMRRAPGGPTPRRRPVPSRSSGTRPTGGRRPRAARTRVVSAGRPGAAPGRAPRAAAGRSGPAMEDAEAAPDRMVPRPLSRARRRVIGGLALRGVLPARGGWRDSRRGRLPGPVPPHRRLVPGSPGDPRPGRPGPRHGLARPRAERYALPGGRPDDRGVPAGRGTGGAPSRGPISPRSSIWPTGPSR